MNKQSVYILYLEYPEHVRQQNSTLGVFFSLRGAMETCIRNFGVFCRETHNEECHEVYKELLGNQGPPFLRDKSEDEWFADLRKINNALVKSRRNDLYSIVEKEVNP